MGRIQPTPWNRIMHNVQQKCFGNLPEKTNKSFTVARPLRNPPPLLLMSHEIFNFKNNHKKKNILPYLTPQILISINYAWHSDLCLTLELASSLVFILSWAETWNVSYPPPWRDENSELLRLRAWFISDGGTYCLFWTHLGKSEFEICAAAAHLRSVDSLVLELIQVWVLSS